MTKLERRALMGDREAQEECTRRGIVLKCPYCGGNGKVSFKDSRFIGENIRGDKKLVYRVQVICNKCRSRGKPVFTEPLINPNPYITKWGNRYHAESEICAEETKSFLPYVLNAISAWNTRPAPPVGRCGECKYYTEEAPGVGCCKDKSGKAEYDFCSCFSRKETKKMGMTKTKATYAVTWAFGKDINAVTADLIQRVGKLTEEEDYCLQGGASLAIDNGMFYAMQTLIKEAEENA